MYHVANKRYVMLAHNSTKKCKFSLIPQYFQLNDNHLVMVKNCHQIQMNSTSIMKIHNLHNYAYVNYQIISKVT